ncbi:hypothetical protein [Bacteroides sp. 224]|uniref:hypothetical protein n=1 Tax=Bacteroides sp. 224 TaxID=2302936 RepID=UPI0013D46AFF|nr:hypothetical protein [Bacteroides sp. 224]
MISLFLPFTLFAQSIDGFGGFKFGTKQKKICETSWVKNNIKDKRGGEIELHIFVSPLQLDAQEYDLCVYQFHQNKLYGGIMAQTFATQEDLLKALDGLKDSLKVDCREETPAMPSIIKEYYFRDSRKNELTAQAVKERKRFILRLHYFSYKLTTKKNEAEEKRRQEEWNKPMDGEADVRDIDE